MKFKRIAAVVLTFVLAFAISPRAALASEKTDVVDAVHRYFDNLSASKLGTALAMCDSHVSILDEFPPHEWHGPTACADWWKELLAYNDKNGITGMDGALGTPWTIDVTGDRAYFVAPITYTYNRYGKPVKETAAFTVALKLIKAGWRITGWAYSKQTLQ
jgi:hypothetical protein